MKNNNKTTINKLHKDILDVEKGCNIAVDVITAINDYDNYKSLEEYPDLKDCIEKNFYFDELSENITKADSYSVYNNIDADVANFKKKINIAKIKDSNRINLKRIIYLSSSVAVAIIFLTFQIYNSPRDMKLGNEFDRTTPYVILSDGTEIDVDSVMGNRTNYLELNNNLAKNNNGQIDDKLINDKENIPETNTIIVPSKCTYTLVLEDGSEVIINANSSLKYPLKFGKCSRSVELKGEAYFNVTKGDIPFIVKNNHLSIKVFGTKFNISSSYGDTFSEAVLISGSIGVAINGTDDKEVMLTPNQMFSYDDRTNTNKVTTVNAFNYIKWIGNTFKYQQTSINDIIGDIERWYGVEITGKIEDQDISMTMNKHVKIDKLLSIIESVTNVKFTKKGGDKYSMMNVL